MKLALLGILVLLVVGLVAGRKFVNVRNDLVAQREGVSAQWEQVDLALQRRADLIPSLMEPVIGHAKHETEVFKDIADARAKLAGSQLPQEKLQANHELSLALARLLAIAESYPQLKASENFLQLQDEIAGTENRIAVERRKYNDRLEHYNAQIQMFPDNIVASLSGFRRNDAYFKTDPGTRTAPEVHF